MSSAFNHIITAEMRENQQPSSRRLPSGSPCQAPSPANALEILPQLLTPNTSGLQPLLSKAVPDPISLLESICSFRDLTAPHEIFLPLPLLILRNAIKTRLKRSRIPRMKGFAKSSYALKAEEEHC